MHIIVAVAEDFQRQNTLVALSTAFAAFFFHYLAHASSLLKKKERAYTYNYEPISNSQVCAVINIYYVDLPELTISGQAKKNDSNFNS